MLIKEKLGNINTTPVINRIIDVIAIEWYEANKRILHKQTKEGLHITIKFLKENAHLNDGDILWQDENSMIAVEIKPCECIVITPGTMFIASSLCYEIGNRHVPLFYEEGELLVPYEIPLHNLLQAAGYDVKVEHRKLINALKTTVLPHLRVAANVSLFSSNLHLSTSL